MIENDFEAAGTWPRLRVYKNVKYGIDGEDI